MHMGHVEDQRRGHRLHGGRQQPGDSQVAGRPHNADKELNEGGRGLLIATEMVP
jgi:hypothetical protein